MASFNGSIDLMQLKGAKLLSGINPDRPQQNYVCIPVDWNEINITQDKQHSEHFYANMRVNLWPVNENFRKACIDRRIQRGDSVEGYNPPSHQMELGYSQDFQKKAREAAKKRLVKEHPDWNPDENQNQELYRAIYEAVRVRLGSFYTNIPKPQQTYQGTAPAASGISGYVPAATDAQDPYQMNTDDLPF